MHGRIARIEVFRVALRTMRAFQIAASSSLGMARRVIDAARAARNLLLRCPRFENVVIKITDDSGRAGWGAAAPLRRVTGETVSLVLTALARSARPWVGRALGGPGDWAESLDEAFHDLPSTRACVDMALHDLWGKACGQPIVELLGGSRHEVMTDFSIGVQSPEVMALHAAVAVGKGFKAVKIKAGGEPVADVQRVQAVRRAIGDHVALRVDANEGWTVRQALDAIGGMRPFQVQFVEQPVPAHDLKGMAEVRRHAGIPIMADEAIHTADDAGRVIEAGAADLINIKLMKCGGIGEALRIATLAESAGIPCMMGCAMETGIGIAAAAHVAASSGNIIHADLDSDLLLENDVVVEGGVTVEGSLRRLGAGPGLGIVQTSADRLGAPVCVYH